MVRRESEVLTVPENKLPLVCIHCITNSTSTEKKQLSPQGHGSSEEAGRGEGGDGEGRDKYMSLHIQQYYSHFTERYLWSVHIFKAEEKEIR